MVATFWSVLYIEGQGQQTTGPLKEKLPKVLGAPQAPTAEFYHSREFEGGRPGGFKNFGSPREHLFWVENHFEICGREARRKKKARAQDFGMQRTFVTWSCGV